MSKKTAKRMNQQAQPDIGGRIGIRFEEPRIEELMEPYLCEICDRLVEWFGAGDGEGLHCPQDAHRVFQRLTAHGRLQVLLDRHKAIVEALTCLTQYGHETPTDSALLVHDLQAILVGALAKLPNEDLE